MCHRMPPSPGRVGSSRHSPVSRSHIAPDELAVLTVSSRDKTKPRRVCWMSSSASPESLFSRCLARWGIGVNPPPLVVKDNARCGPNGQRRRRHDCASCEEERAVESGRGGVNFPSDVGGGEGVRRMSEADVVA